MSSVRWFLPLILLLAFQPAQEVSLDYRLRLVELINQNRQAAGVPPVAYSEELSRAADEHCREMLAGGFISHWNRAGWTPYLRYAAAGVSDFTAENIWSRRQQGFPSDPGTILGAMEDGHRSFMAEQAPRDAHRRTVLHAQHTHVGIGVAYDSTGMRLIEVFATRAVELDPLPFRARHGQSLGIAGRVRDLRDELYAISIFYEPLPQPMSRLELEASSSYSFPREERLYGPKLQGSIYSRGIEDAITVGGGGVFSMPFYFWKGQPGVYTVAVWLRRGGGESFVGASFSVWVE